MYTQQCESVRYITIGLLGGLVLFLVEEQLRRVDVCTIGTQFRRNTYKRDLFYALSAEAHRCWPPAHHALCMPCS